MAVTNDGSALNWSVCLVASDLVAVLAELVVICQILATNLAWNVD